MSVVVVTGAGQGQGAAEARLLAAHGTTVIATDLAASPAEDLPGTDYRQLDVTPADLHRVYEVNVTGALLGIQAIAPLMTVGGSVVLVGSAAALTGRRTWPRPRSDAPARSTTSLRWSPSCSATTRRTSPGPRSRSTAA